jgi:hypothetical protein
VLRHRAPPHRRYARGRSTGLRQVTGRLPTFEIPNHRMPCPRDLPPSTVVRVCAQPAPAVASSRVDHPSISGRRAGSAPAHPSSPHSVRQRTAEHEPTSRTATKQTGLTCEDSITQHEPAPPIGHSVPLGLLGRPVEGQGLPSGPGHQVEVQSAGQGGHVARSGRKSGAPNLAHGQVRRRSSGLRTVARCVAEGFAFEPSYLERWSALAD